MDGISKIIGENMAELRDAIGLSQNDFALLTGISRATLINIESGAQSTKIKSLDGIINLTRIELDKLTKKGFTPPENFREKLLQKHKEDPAIFVVLNNTPSIPYILKYKVLKTDFMEVGRERWQIVKFISDKYGWKINGNSLTTALKRLPKLIDIQPHPTKGGTNLYTKKK